MLGVWMNLAIIIQRCRSFFFADLDENCMNLRVLLLRSYYITYKVPGFLFGIFFCISRYHRQCTCLMILSKLSTQSVEIFSMQTLLKRKLSKNLTLNIQIISWVRQIVWHFYDWKVDVKIFLKFCHPRDKIPYSWSTSKIYILFNI